ncbi:hypothetical protein BJ875DRAFT_439204 [Amylocarpus encephaloides]|uniref:Uncharacterized protein n=1 Tax=Amylocarpus encephaloides TaxID=45428 RepID=A0A9P7YN34_9HELO|nr:hypothetical protein BJ875DRAFT_439204 [Amylocarpus encephaloides]
MEWTAGPMCPPRTGLPWMVQLARERPPPESNPRTIRRLSLSRFIGAMNHLTLLLESPDLNWIWRQRAHTVLIQYCTGPVFPGHSGVLRPRVFSVGEALASCRVMIVVLVILDMKPIWCTPSSSQAIFESSTYPPTPSNPPLKASSFDGDQIALKALANLFYRTRLRSPGRSPPSRLKIKTGSDRLLRTAPTGSSVQLRTIGFGGASPCPTLSL